MPSGDISTWTRRAYTAADARDAAGFVQSLSDDVRMRFGNAPPVTGRDAVQTALEAFFTTMRGLRHHISGEWRAGDALMLDSEVTYTRLDGREVTVPAFTIFHFDAGTVDADAPLPDGAVARRVQMYVDLTPLYAEGETSSEAALDEADEESFPASDPPAWGAAHVGSPEPR